MYQTEGDNSSYRTKESGFKQFRRSCLGKIVIAAGVFVILLIIAWLTNPSEKKMWTEMLDNIRQSIESRDSIEADWMDVFVSNIGNIFSKADGEPNQARLDLFNKFNIQEYYDNTFFSTMHVYNSVRAQDEVCGIGIFGLVIPLANFNKFLPREGPMRTEYNQPLIEPSGNGDEYYGETNVDVFHYQDDENN